jgi:membrane protease subunit HflC
MNRTLIFAAIGVVVSVVLVFSTLFVVSQTEQALVLQFGDPKRVVNTPGLHAKLPFVQNVVRMEKRILNYDAPAEEVIASDQKRLVVDAVTRFRITDPLRFYQAVGNEAVARSRLGSVVNSAQRQVFGSVPLQSVLSPERAALTAQIASLVNAQVLELGIQVIDVRIKRADLPEANNQAIYDRMKSERQREAREFRAQGGEQALRIRSRADRERTIIIAEAEREAQILRGTGDAERIKVLADAYGRDAEFFAFYRALQAYQQALGSQGTSMVLSPDSEFFRYFGQFPEQLFRGDARRAATPRPATPAQ